MKLLKCSIFTLAFLFIFSLPAAGQSVGVVPTMGIDMRAPNDGILLRLGGVVSWTEYKMGAAVRANGAVVGDGGGFSLSAGPSIRVFNEEGEIVTLIPEIGFSRMSIEGLSSAPYGVKTGLLVHLMHQRGAVIAGVEHTFKGARDISGLHVTRGPYTSIVVGVGVAF